MRTRAFSLIEVLISIVVLALGLLGIAAVFPAVVTQQRTTTDSVQGGSLQESVKEYITSHRLLNRASVRQLTNPTTGALRPVQRADLRGWQLLVDNQYWSEPVARSAGLFDGDFQLVGDDTAQPGINTDRASGITWILNGDPTQPSVTVPGDPALLNEPVAWISVTERQLPVWSTRTGPPERPEALYIWDFTARRLGAGIPNRVPGATADQEALSRQDDMVQVAVFIRRKDKATTRNTAPPVPVGEDANGRPTYDGTGAYSLIREATYTLPNTFDPATGTGPTDVLDFDTLPNARYLAQIGQKMVDQWGQVHEVVDATLVAADHAVITIRSTSQRIDATTQRPNEGIKIGNAKAYMQAGVPLKMIFTNQIPVSVSVFDVRPAPIPRT